MNDDSLRDWRRDWQAQDHDVASALQRLRRQRWRPHWVLLWEILGCVVAGSIGLWFAWVAAHDAEQRVLFALSAAVMLITAPVLGVAILMARRHSLAWSAESPQSLLEVGVRRVDASLRAIRVGYWHIAIVAVFVAGLWVAQAAGMIRALGFLIFYTGVCAIACIVSAMWMRRRTAQLRKEHAAYRGLLAKLRVDGEEV